MATGPRFRSRRLGTTKTTTRPSDPGRRAAARIGGFLAAAAVTSFVIGWYGGDGSLREWLLSAAGALELSGVLLVASPELAPVLLRAGEGLAAVRKRTRTLTRAAANRVLRMLARQPRPHVASGASASSLGGGIRARGIVGLGEGATDEEKIAYLLERDRKTQEQLRDHQEELNELPKRWRADIEAMGGTLRSEQNEKLDELRGEHLTERLGGVVLLVVGLALATWGNLA